MVSEIFDIIAWSLKVIVSMINNVLDWTHDVIKCLPLSMIQRFKALVL